MLFKHVNQNIPLKYFLDENKKAEKNWRKKCRNNGHHTRDFNG